MSGKDFFLVGNTRAELPRGKCPSGEVVRGELPEGNCPRGGIYLEPFHVAAVQLLIIEYSS